jgi:flagellar basal body-associated protein FliL
MRKISLNNKGFAPLLLLVGVAVVLVLGGGGAYVYHQNHKAKAPVSSSTTNTKTSTQTSTTAAPVAHTAQEAVTFVQKTYDDYLTALNSANSDTSHAQPVAQVGLAAVRNNISSDLYAKAAAVTQATPFSCTAQFVTDKYTASLSSSGNTSAVVAVSISNGGGLHTDGMTATVDLATLKITSVTCPS